MLKSLSAKMGSWGEPVSEILPRPAHKVMRNIVAILQPTQDAWLGNLLEAPRGNDRSVVEFDAQENEAIGQCGGELLEVRGGVVCGNRTDIFINPFAGPLASGFPYSGKKILKK